MQTMRALPVQELLLIFFHGKKIILKRKDVNLDKHDYFWEFSLGKNKKISDKDFVQDEIKRGDVEE